MSEVRIIEKPQDISYAVIKDIMYRAHESNRQKGIFMHSVELSPEQLEAKVGENGKTFIAEIDGKIVGTASLEVVRRNAWYAKGQGDIADEIFVGVLPESKGHGIYSKLYAAIEDEARARGYGMVVFNTAAKNKTKQDISRKKGFVPVGWFVSKDNDHYSVIMAKWLGKCPFSKIYIKLRFLYSKWLVTIRYKPGKVKRFGI